MSSQLISRLESVVSRLEKFANSKLAAGGGGGAGSAAGSAAVSGFESYYNNSAQPFINAANKFKETAPVAAMVEKALKCMRELIEASAQCKKPTPQELGAFVEPIAKVISDAERMPDKRNATWFPFHKAFAEGVVAFQWVMSTAPKIAIESGLEPAEVYLNTILMAAKKLTGEQQADYRAYVSTWKALLNGMLAFTTEFYKMGLDWNPKGVALTAFKAGGGASAAGLPEAPDAPEAPPAPPGDLPAAPAAPGDLPSAGDGGASEGGLAAVFNQLNNLGECGVTKGLRKVTKDMKTKNMKDVPVLQPKDGKPAAKSAAKEEKKEKAKRPPKLELAQGTWFCENYENQPDMTIPDVQMKENVYISHCKNCLIRVPDKAKSIQVDTCQKVTVIFKAVVSTFEVVNSSSITADCQEQCPSFALDKSNGVQVVMSASVVNQIPAPPDIVSSCITACNVVVPGKSEKDDPIEIPLPEQYITKYDPKTFKISTENIKHSG